MINNLKRSVYGMIQGQRLQQTNKLRYFRKIKQKERNTDEQVMTELRSKIANKI